MQENIEQMDSPIQRTELQQKQFELISANKLDDIKSITDLEERIVTYVNWHKGTHGLCKLATLNRRFMRAAKQFDLTPKLVIETLALKGDTIALDAMPGKPTLIVYPVDYPAEFQSIHAEIQTPPHEVADFWEKVCNNAI